MKRISIITLALTFVFVSFTALAGGESNKAKKPGKATVSIEGIVTDHLTGETLVGATIKLEGSDEVAYTDLDGKFSFENLKPGSYDIVVTYISYKNSLVENLQFEKGKTASKDLAIKMVEE